MGSSGDKIKGKANEVLGKVTGDKPKKRKGKAQQTSGDKIKGKANEVVGKVTGDKPKKGKGKAQQTKGERSSAKRRTPGGASRNPR